MAGCNPICSNGRPARIPLLRRTIPTGNIRHQHNTRSQLPCSFQYANNWTTNSNNVKLNTNYKNGLTYQYPCSGSDMVTTTFQRTPLIPTYLIAFMISDFVHVSSVDANNFEQRVYHRPTAVVDNLTALKHGVKVQAALNSYLEIDYPLPKMDHVGLQGFHFGAMENWGMITYKFVFQFKRQK